MARGEDHDPSNQVLLLVPQTRTLLERRKELEKAPAWVPNHFPSQSRSTGVRDRYKAGRVWL